MTRRARSSVIVLLSLAERDGVHAESARGASLPTTPRRGEALPLRPTRREHLPVQPPFIARSRLGPEVCDLRRVRPVLEKVLLAFAQRQPAVCLRASRVCVGNAGTTVEIRATDAALMASLHMRLVAATGTRHERAHDRPPPGFCVFDAIPLRGERPPLRITLEVRRPWAATSAPAAGLHLRRPRAIATGHEVLLRLAEGSPSSAETRNIGAAFLLEGARPAADAASIQVDGNRLVPTAGTGNPLFVSGHGRGLFELHRPFVPTL